MFCWQLQNKNEPLVKVEKDALPLKEGWARVQVAGCGLCHTDLGFMFSDVETRHPLPLTLGHEISGIVLEGRGKGEQVLIPAVIPCRNCAPCNQGLPRICKNQLMPGNDMDGGFASHIDVPAHDLIILSQPLEREKLSQLSVVADAVTTPLQAIHNLGLRKGDVAVVVGCGGVGSFGAMIAHAMGATVIAMDIDDNKLARLTDVGIPHTLNVMNKDVQTVRKWLRELVKAEGLPDFGHKIFETSGSTPGQELAFALLGHGAGLAVVGFTLARLNLRLSNLMAFDARVVGNWGASPEIYPEAVQLAAQGALHLDNFTECFPLSEINGVIEMARQHKLEKRAVLVP